MASELIVRVAGEQDLDRVLTVHVAHEPGRSVTGAETTTWERMQRTPDLTVYLAEIDGLPVGTASLLLMPNLTYACAPTGFLEAVVVVPGHRRRGVATAMLRQVLEDADDAGCDKIQLLSHKRHADDGAHDLYRSVGFEPEAEGFRRYLRRPG